MRAKLLRALALGALLLAASITPSLASTGRSHAQAARPAARSAATSKPTISSALQSLQRSAQITPAEYAKYSAAYAAAKRSLGKLSGTRRAELGAVMANVEAMAAGGYFIASRLPVIFFTLEHNRQWWTSEPLVGNGTRVSFPHSLIVWEHYAGQGIEIQWLGTFGEANGYYLSGHENANLHQLLGEVLPLATKRAGGIAWEYMFQFDGGKPPWTSGLSQGTALQVFSRSWSRFKEPALLTAAQQALGIFQTPPPNGVQVKTAAGSEYAEYTYAPSDRILNGFIQAVVGLYDYTQITKDPLGLKLFEAGDAEARTETPHYDTGAWSQYDQYSESDLNYHELLTEFLQHLCERSRKGLPIPATPAPAPTPTTSTPTTTAPTTSAPTSTTPTTTSPTTTSGGTEPVQETARGADARAAASKPVVTPIAGDEIYCTTAQHFTTYEKTPPVLSLLSKTLKGGTRAGVQLSLSKVSTVRLTVKQGSRTVWTNSAYVERGKPKLLWQTPAGGGTFSVTLSASDPAGNFATTTGTIVVSKH
ncbi:MAG TPA: D-glucuronyl C5-epimerase family protein [Solirubrobacteraceae bacterium]|nr:D-glucuronyl C5-epimerase family protein [Solirubrobacteraceae bacterium]